MIVVVSPNTGTLRLGPFSIGYLPRSTTRETSPHQTAAGNPAAIHAGSFPAERPDRHEAAQKESRKMIARRDLLRSITGTIGLLGWPSGHASGEPPPETTRLRVKKDPNLCEAPAQVAEALLRAEGFSE